MSTELSTPIKIVALAGLLIAAGAAATMLLLRGHSTSKPVAVHVTPTHVRAQAHSHPATARHVTPAANSFVPGLPAPLVAALAHGKLVVAVVWAKGDPVAAEVLAQARQGARAAHAPLVVLNVAHDAVAGQTATWMKSDIVEPAVLVVERPGTIAVELAGYADKTAVAQAVVDSRR
jgi:hypothetical protein